MKSIIITAAALTVAATSAFAGEGYKATYERADGTQVAVYGLPNADGQLPASIKHYLLQGKLPCVAKPFEAPQAVNALGCNAFEEDGPWTATYNHTSDGVLRLAQDVHEGWYVLRARKDGGWDFEFVWK